MQEKRTEDALLEKAIFTMVSLTFRAIFGLIRTTKWTLLWLIVLVAICTLHQYAWIAALVLAIAPLCFRQTRGYGIFVRDYLNLRNYWKLRRAVRLGNQKIREMGIISVNDEEVYPIQLYSSPEVDELYFDGVLPGLDHESIKSKALSFKPLFNALRVETEDLSNGSLVVRFFKVDNLAGSREVEQRSDLKVRIARLQNGEDAHLDLSKAYHIGLQGQTRSGKSALTYGILSQLAGCEAIEIWGIDLNAALLAPLADHSDASRFVLDEENLDDVVELLESFSEEMRVRLKELRDSKRDKFAVFDRDHPVKLLVLEEYAGLMDALDGADKDLKPAERRKSRVVSMVGRLVREGAKAGIRVMILTQRADSSSMSTNTRDQLVERITMRVGNKEAVRMFHEDLPEELSEQVKDFPQGRMIFESPNGRFVGQADYLGYGADPNDEDALYNEYKLRIEHAYESR